MALPFNFKVIDKQTLLLIVVPFPVYNQQGKKVIVELSFKFIDLC